MRAALSRVTRSFRRAWQAAVTGDLSGATAPNSHHAVHWGTVLAVLLCVTGLVHLLEGNAALLGYRYAMFQFLSRLGPQRYSVENIVVATIDDETYWQGEPAGRVPTDRRYLAKTIRRIADAEPRLIALDFDLRSPDPQGKLRSAVKENSEVAADAGKTPLELPVHEAQLAESIELFRVADQTAATIPMILPCTVKVAGDACYAVSDADDGYPYAGPQIAHGYLQLADDRRVIPPVLTLEDGAKLDSFATAIVRQVAPHALEEQASREGSTPAAKHDGGHGHRDLRYASFVPRDRIPTVTTSELFHASSEIADTALEKLRGKIVLIGADWHSRSLGEGPPIDGHPSPVGLLPGVMLHANYAESLLQGKWVTPAGMWAATLVEWLLTALVAFLLIAKIGWRTKLVWFAGLAAVYPLLSLFGMRLLGVYTDVIMLTAALAIHLVADVPTQFIHLTLKVRDLERRLTGQASGGH